jgi:hypothetical protein
LGGQRAAKDGKPRSFMGRLRNQNRCGRRAKRNIYLDLSMGRLECNKVAIVYHRGLYLVNKKYHFFNLKSFSGFIKPLERLVLLSLGANY